MLTPSALLLSAPNALGAKRKNPTREGERRHHVTAERMQDLGRKKGVSAGEPQLPPPDRGPGGKVQASPRLLLAQPGGTPSRGVTFGPRGFSPGETQAQRLPRFRLGRIRAGSEPAGAQAVGSLLENTTPPPTPPPAPRPGQPPAPRPRARTSGAEGRQPRPPGAGGGLAGPPPGLRGRSPPVTLSGSRGRAGGGRAGPGSPSRSPPGPPPVPPGRPRPGTGLSARLSLIHI